MSTSIHSSRSASQTSRHSDRSAISNRSVPPPGPILTPSHDGTFETCAATASFFLYAQRNIILCLHHDTLALERRFERHREDVQWIATDNVSDQGNGRLVVSYDSSQTTIVWDLFTGKEVARFASYEEIRVAVWMKNANIAFGNSQGNVILFEPSTSEHISARTIFDPITALAPSSDCRTFAIGYMNGSILIATLQPSFTILHTLSTNRPPSTLNKLAWHGSSSKQKSDMLAAQTVDGDLRVWSIPKTANGDSPSIIRVLSRTENDRISGANWFGWSKTGRIVQYSEGLTFVWDVRTKRVTYESVPTVDGLVGITIFGPSATLFTLGRNHTVQQYDLNPNSRPMLVQNVQHVPAKLPPSPPISDGDLRKNRNITAGRPDVQHQPNTNLPLYLEVESSEGEGNDMTMSPLQRIAKDLDQIDEQRDRVGPLSPVSSRSSVKSRSSAGKQREVVRSSSRNELSSESLGRAASPGMTSDSTRSGTTGTVFSQGSSNQSGFPNRAMRDSVSTRSLLSNSTSASALSRAKPSNLRQEVLYSPQDGKGSEPLDLFPFTRARLADIPFQPPSYDQNRRTPDDLRAQMLNVVFGWPNDIELLIREELNHHPAGSTGGVLLSKWLGELGADFAASMIGSQSMTSSDWMLLALAGMGQDSQKKVGEAFVQRLLEKGDVHPAVAILLGLGEYDDAVEVYVSRKFYMEAVLLTCLFFPADWRRQSYLVRKWGEVAVACKQAELAVRCFSCTSMESSEPWFSPRAQDAVYAMQQNIMGPDTPLSMGTSPISPAGGNTRMRPSMAGLTLVTTFTKSASKEPRSAVDDKTPMVYAETPIESAVTPGGFKSRPYARNDPASALSTRTATPGGYGRRRYPSSSRTKASQQTPQTATKSSSLAPSEATASSYRNRSASASQAGSSLFSSSTQYQANSVERGRSGLPSPAQGVFARLRDDQMHIRNGSRERKPEGLSLHVEDVMVDFALPSGNTLPSGITNSEHTNIITGGSSIASAAQLLRHAVPSPSLQSGNSLQSSKIRGIDQYISSVEEANFEHNQQRGQTGTRPADSEPRPQSRTTRRAPSDRGGVRYVKPAKRSPSSPVSMSPDDPALQNNNMIFDDERFYQQTKSPLRAPSAPRQNRDRSQGRTGRTTSRVRPTESTDRGDRPRSKSRVPHNASREESCEEPQIEVRGRSRSNGRAEGQANRSPESPRPMSPAGSAMSKSKVGERVRERSMSRRPRSPGNVRRTSPEPSVTSRKASRSRMPKLQTNMSDTTAMVLKKRELAAQELEARRLSLAMRPSAPAIVHPDALIPKSAIELSTSDAAFYNFGGASKGTEIVRGHTADILSPLNHFGLVPSDIEFSRGHTADPHTLPKMVSGSPGPSSRTPPIGLPATPRAMRHPKYMSDSDSVQVPAVPMIPDNYSNVQQAAQEQNALTTLPVSTILPATTFSPSRSASAPLEKLFTLASSHQRFGSHVRPGHSRQNSGNEVTVILPSPTGAGPAISRTIDEALHEHDDVIIVDNSPKNNAASSTAVLPELQHLAGPSPPPPPPPPMILHSNAPNNESTIVDITIQEQQERKETPILDQANRMASPETAQPLHRRGRGSIGGGVSENLGQKFRNARDRLRDRSGSRNRTMTTSPPMPGGGQGYTPAAQRRPSLSTMQRSAYETPITQAVNVSGSSEYMVSDAQQEDRQQQHQQQQQQLQQQQYQPSLLPSTTYGGYRNPKEIARQMTHEQMQFGTYAVPDRVGAQSAPSFSSRSSVYQSYRDRGLRANMPPGQLQYGVEPHPDGSGRI